MNETDGDRHAVGLWHASTRRSAPSQTLAVPDPRDHAERGDNVHGARARGARRATRRGARVGAARQHKISRDDHASRGEVRHTASGRAPASRESAQQPHAVAGAPSSSRGRSATHARSSGGMDARLLTQPSRRALACTWNLHDVQIGESFRLSRIQIKPWMPNIFSVSSNQANILDEHVHTRR